ncbi:FRG domain-containing protein [Pseudomonas aeruginosa]
MLQAKRSTQAKPICFFRGHADVSWQLLPGVYRLDSEGRSFRTDESRLFHEMLRCDSSAFAEDKTTFEWLARMQHYGLPTRLLDITANSLVALFFACTDLQETDGEVFAFPWPDRRTLIHQRDLPPTSMAGVEAALDLSQLGQQVVRAFYNHLLDERKRVQAAPSGHLQFDGAIRELLERIDRLLPAVMVQCSEPLLSFGCFREVETIIREFNGDWIKQLEQEEGGGTRESNLRARIFLHEMLTRASKWETRTTASLCDQMGIPDQSTRQSLADFLHALTYFHFVTPPLNNARIGAHLFGPFHKISEGVDFCCFRHGFAHATSSEFVAAASLDVGRL